MPRFLIEVSHESEHEGCVRALHALVTLGSHYVTHADWGCKHGVHKGWLVAELNSKDDAQRLVPPSLRIDSRVVELNKFTEQEIKELIQELPSE